MKVSDIWDRTKVWWWHALELPTLEWARPVLGDMGLPTALAEQPEVWASIFPLIDIEYKRRQQAKDWEVGTIKGAIRIWRESVTYALQELAKKMGPDVAIELERWTIRHFLFKELRWAMTAWYYALNEAYWPPNTSERQVPPPAVLIPILPEIESLVTSEEREKLTEKLQQISPPLEPDDLLSMCGEALAIDRVINEASTIKALQIIARKLNEAERTEVVAWAELQVAKLSPSLVEPEQLKGGKYLRIEPPLFDLPSVLDFPDYDEEREI